MLLIIAAKHDAAAALRLQARDRRDEHQAGDAAFTVAFAFVLAYALGRFSGVLFDNLRNIVFERVGQDATRALAEDVFARLHRLSMRFHLARRTGEVTKVIERGTKSIDVMLYFMLFNIAPDRAGTDGRRDDLLLPFRLGAGGGNRPGSGRLCLGYPRDHRMAQCPARGNEQARRPGAGPRGRFAAQL